MQAVPLAGNQLGVFGAALDDRGLDGLDRAELVSRVPGGLGSSAGSAGRLEGYAGEQASGGALDGLVAGDGYVHATALADGGSASSL